MGVASANCYTDWNRDFYNPTLRTTGPPQPHQSNIITHAAIIPTAYYHELPASARKASYVFQVPSGTDIVTGDYLSAVRRTDTGAPWPDDYPDSPTEPGYGNVVWIVRYHQESTPGPAGYRSLYLEKIQLGGPASPYS